MHIHTRGLFSLVIANGTLTLQAQRQKLWEKLTSDPDVAAKCQILDGKSDVEKLHSMLNEEFWGVDVDEESGLVYMALSSMHLSV